MPQFYSTNRPLLLQHMRGNYLECPCNHLTLQTGFSNNLKHKSKHRGGQLQQPKQTTAQVLLCSKFQESDLKSKSWMKASAGAYVSKLRKSDARDILYFWVTSDPSDSCHKPTRDTAPVMSPNLIWALLQKSHYERWKFHRVVSVAEQQGAAECR